MNSHHSTQLSMFGLTYFMSACKLFYCNQAHLKMQPVHVCFLTDTLRQALFQTQPNLPFFQVLNMLSEGKSVIGLDICPQIFVGQY